MPGLADLHVHLYGAIRPADLLAYLGGRDIDWGPYERSYARAYEHPPPVREILARHARGERVDDAWERLFVFGEADAGNFARFQAKFDLLLAGSAFRSIARGAGVTPLLDELRYFIDRIQAEQVRRGIGYAEHRVLFGPQTPGETVERACEEILEAFAAETRTVSRLALSLPRDDPWPHWAIAQRLAVSAHGSSLTGVDFCFVEEGFPPKDKAELFSAVSGFNQEHPERALAILYHVGESFADKSLESAVRWVEQAAMLGAHRLGHAIALGVDPAAYGPHVREESVSERRDQIEWDLLHAGELAEFGVDVDVPKLAAERESLRGRRNDERLTLGYDAQRLDRLRRLQDFAMDRVRDSGAVVEVCPTSNLRIGGIRDPRHHPVRRFAERAVPYVVCSDDPGIFGTTLHDELAWVERELELDPRELAELIERSWRCRSERLSGREPA